MSRYATTKANCSTPIFGSLDKIYNTNPDSYRVNNEQKREKGSILFSFITIKVSYVIFTN